ncbi:hypothetical protein NDU88_005810 [Pleurodeles waltl]|uniref:Uncharacterized protein n=1 Tax=Pleurodeles waltl TaxID=8319 RepID=A0AAV7UKK0_PLEWA|nr:hypothetical protein NDU88_005810 [Pleurodeles waltl]
MTATQMRRIYTPGQKSRPGGGGSKNPAFAPLFNAWVRVGGVVYANSGVGAVIDPVYPLSLSLSPLACFVIVSLCALASSGRGEEAPVMEGDSSHRTLEAEPTDAEGTSGTDGKGSTTAETGGDNTDLDTSSDESSLVVTDTSVTTPAIGTPATPHTSTALPAAPQRVAHARSPWRVGISFAPGTSALPQ